MTSRLQDGKEIQVIRKIHIAIISIVVFALASALPHQAHADAERNILVDSLGRRVKGLVNIERIACVYAFTGHVVAMLGRANDIVAVSNGLKRDVLLKTMYPAIGKALVPKYQGAINIEELARTKPDVVFVSTVTGRNDAEIAKLDSCGLTWLMVEFHTMEQQQQAIALIGQAIGASKKAAEYNAYYRGCIARTRKAMGGFPVENRVRLFHATVEPTRTSAKNSLPSDWIRAAGVINVAALEQGRLMDGGHQVGIEQILLWNPDVILTNEPGVADFIKKSPKWSVIAAVKKGAYSRCRSVFPAGDIRGLWKHPLPFCGRQNRCTLTGFAILT